MSFSLLIKPPQTQTVTQVLRFPSFIDLRLLFCLPQMSKDGCGKTKSCYSEPKSCTSSSDCQYLVTIKPVGDEDSDDGEVEFELSTTDQWVSIGFNNEKNKMVRTRSDIGYVRRAYLPCGLSLCRLLN